jgi:hypothetical protein
MKIKIPKNQILWVTHCDEEHNPQYIITSDQQITKYILYKVTKDFTLEKIRTSIRPIFKEVEY